MTDELRMKSKVCLVGEGAVGKTCLIRRFIHDQFEDKYISTLGAKVSKKEVSVAGNSNEEVRVDLTVWDIMGEKGFRELLKEAYFHGASGILAVCDITRKNTLTELGDWISAVNKVTGPIPLLFLGNKSDLADSAQVTDDEMRRFAGTHKAPYYFTSARTGQNVEQAFRQLATLIAQKQMARQVA